ncbi:uncharacterized protein IUM83_12148 [Phytophthora cinnamomi]|uniref:uncharacterized protein n=1 Tax=Phytophthora cinnamomi TaxID=4785 RepID=UPI00355A826D|nr:hypothetical protein IUM83_12148 [Phytophthora cinnamomi]
MPRPADSPAPSSASSSPAASPDGGFLCERLQQLRQRVRSRCLAADAAEAGAIPCLLQSWRKRIEAMDDAPQMHRHHRGHRHFGHHHRRPCHAAAEDSDDTLRKIRKGLGKLKNIDKG